MVLRFDILKSKGAIRIVLSVLFCLCAIVAIAVSSAAPSNLIKLTSDNQVYAPGGNYWAHNSVWGKGTLVNGVDYSQSISINTITFPRNTVMSWKWPSKQGPYGVYSFPEILFGNDGYHIPPPSPRIGRQVANFSIVAAYSIRISGQPSGFGVILDLWLTASPEGDLEDRLYEIDIALHSNATQQIGSMVYRISNPNEDGLNNATVSVARDWGGESHKWTMVSVMPPSDQLSGRLDLGNLLKGLISNGVISGREFVSGVELGAEPSLGSGQLTIDDLRYDWE
jgi:hypothetical protein